MEKKEKATKVAPKPSASALAEEIREATPWVRKNRVYKLSGKHKNTPFVIMQSSDGTGRGARRLLWFDEEKGYERALRYVRNHPSPFIDDQEESKGVLSPGHIVFEKGMLLVDARETSLQKFLEHHPANEKNGGKGPIKFYEHDPAVIAKQEVDDIMSEAEALQAALNADLATTEAILRPQLGNSIHDKKSAELTRELLIYAKRNPIQFMEDLSNDNLLLQNAAYTAIDFGIISIADSGRSLIWNDTKKKILALPFGDNPYKFVGDWFTTDEGLEYLNKITQKLKK